MNGYHQSSSGTSDGFGGFTPNLEYQSDYKGKSRDQPEYDYHPQSQQQNHSSQAPPRPPNQQPHPHSNTNRIGNPQPQLHSFRNGAPPHSLAVSPLDTLVKRGKQVAGSATTSSASSPYSSSSGSTSNYQAAFKLSRRTSLRSRTTGGGGSSRRRGTGASQNGETLEEEQDELRHALDDGDDDSRSLRSINLLAEDGDSLNLGRRNQSGSGSSSYQADLHSSGRGPKSPQTGYEEDGSGPQRFREPNSNQNSYYKNRESSDLLGGAFRDSIASDISFNSITGNSERNSMSPNHLLSASTSSPNPSSSSYNPSPSLQRRESIDTVRSSEFGETGRWGKAWASNSDDEDSLWDGGEGSNWDDDSNADRRSLMERDLDMEGEDMALTNSMKRTTLTSPNPTPASLYKNEMKKQDQQQGQQNQHYQNPNINSNQAQIQVQVNSPNHNPQLHPGLSRQHVVSLTPSIQDSSSTYPVSPNLKPHDRDSVSTMRGLSGSSRDSVSTLRSGDNGSDSHLNDPARVYVWPPSPAGSTASSIRSRNGDRLGSGLNPRCTSSSGSSSSPSSSGFYNGIRVVEPQVAEIETASLYSSEASWDSQAEEMEQNGTSDSMSHAHSDNSGESSGSSSSGEFFDAPDYRPRPTGPVGPSAILARPLNTPLVGPAARTGNLSDGRRDSSGSLRSGHPAGRPPPPAPGGYSDPNRAMGMNSIGKTRAKAIADADGRESMISDLDVETLRLEMSSRRDSTSTVGSRMSVGTVKWGDDEQENQLRGLNQEFGGRRSSESSYRNQSRQVEDTPKVASLANRGFQQQSPQFPIAGNHFSPHSFPTQRKTSLDAPHNYSSASSFATSSPTLQGGPHSSNSSQYLTSSAVLSAPTNRPAPTPQPTDTRTGPTKAEELLSQGIAYHEQGDLSRSAYYLERSAKTDGGCVVGMCMWGMALREGWGVRKDQKRGAEWIQTAARKAGEMMGNEANVPKSEQELKAIKSELKLSVYELGKCYCYGWGVKMDKKMSLEYFELAGKLGDPDAAAEAGALWAAGKGCKKDLKKAAAFYRMAIEAGYDGVGLSWVYKQKWL